MNKYLLFLIVLILIKPSYTQGQHQYYCKKFQIGASGEVEAITPLHGWTTVNWGSSANDTSSNVWYISGYIDCDGGAFYNPSCIGSCMGYSYGLEDPGEDQCLYVGKNYYPNLPMDTAALGAVYNKGCNNATHKLAQSEVISCPYSKDLVVEFDFIGVGDLCHRDYCRFRYSQDAGATWKSLGGCLLSPNTTVPLWSHMSFNIPDTTIYSGRTIRLGFEWKNDSDCTGHIYSFAVDNIKLTGTSLCPEVSFTTVPTGVCTGSAVLFTNTSVANTTISSILWDFGDGASSTSAGPVSHTYTTQPTSPAKLTITNNYGCITYAEEEIGFSSTTPSVSSIPCIGWYPQSNPNIYLLKVDACVIMDETEILVMIPQIQMNVLYQPGGNLIYFPSNGSYTINIIVRNYCGTITHTETKVIVI